MDGEGATQGARYGELVGDYPWFMLALERAKVGWEAALCLAERLTLPPLDWFTIEQAATNTGGLRPSAPWFPDLGDRRGPAERLLRPYRCVAVAVLADLGAACPTDDLLGPLPEDGHRNPSRLLQAGIACGVTQPRTEDGTRGARKARTEGRRLLHALGAWPWCTSESGRLHSRWWSKVEVVEDLATYLHEAELRAQSASEMRMRIAARHGLA